MTTHARTRRFGRTAALATAAVLFVAMAAPIARAQKKAPKQPAPPAPQQHFATPEDAISALAIAAKGHDRPAIGHILGPRAKDLMSGDDVRDTLELDAFAKLVGEKVAVERRSEARVEFVLGEIGWPFAIPAVSDPAGWRFDTDAGVDEVLSRRIGGNEIAAILTCRAYALAQWEYFTTGDWDHDGVAEYAQRLRSSDGARDGLYWQTVGDDPPSPLGDFVKRAVAAGYRVPAGGDGRVSVPYLGYRFKILTRQGPHAPGGAYSYVINGNMIAGFALVAFPVARGKSGVMTFVVNQQGRVYQKDLGTDTATIAAAMEVYDPDPTWTLSDE